MSKILQTRVDGSEFVKAVVDRHKKFVGFAKIPFFKTYDERIIDRMLESKITKSQSLYGRLIINYGDKKTSMEKMI